MTVERHLARSGYTLDGDVYRHPMWLGWVGWSHEINAWHAMDANGVIRSRGNIVELLRDSGAPALVGVPA